MRNLTKMEETALEFMSKAIESQKISFHGKDLWEYLDKDSLLGFKIVKFLEGQQCLTSYMGPIAVRDAPAWVLYVYRIEPRAHVAVSDFIKGKDPFDSRQSIGDTYNTRLEGNSSAIAIGREAIANNYNGLSDDLVKDLFKQMTSLVNQLPKAEQEDGEDQVNRLATAARDGVEAVEGRKKSFLRFIDGLKDNTETVLAMTAIYKVAIAIFAYYGVILPALPDGL